MSKEKRKQSTSYSYRTLQVTSALQKLLSPLLSLLQQFHHQESGASPVMLLQKHQPRTLPKVSANNPRCLGCTLWATPERKRNFLLMSSLRESFHPIPLSSSLLREKRRKVFSFNPSPQIEFPSVTVCNQNRIKCSNLKARVEEEFS